MTTRIDREDITRAPLTHLFSVAAPTRLTWCGLWVWATGERRMALPEGHEALIESEARAVQLYAVKRHDVVCDRCAELCLRATVADIERLRALRKEGRTR